jgi:hypothetical protein
MNMQSENINELADALSKTQGVIHGAVKDATNPFHKSKYADLHSVILSAKEPLAANNLSVVQQCQIIDGQTCLVTMLMHKSGQWIKSVMPLMLSKTDPQSLGIAITYYRRYCYSALLGISQMDDDAESAMERKPKPEPVKEAAPKAPSDPTADDLMYALAKIGANADKDVIDRFVVSLALEKAKPVSAIIKSALSSQENLAKVGELLTIFKGAPLPK